MPNRYLLDTNIVIYLLNGDSALQHLLVGIYPVLSVINEIELLAFKGFQDKGLESMKRFIVEECEVVEMRLEIKNLAIELLRRYSLKLPDAVIAATALYLNIPLISADVQFQKVDELDLLLHMPSQFQ